MPAAVKLIISANLLVYEVHLLCGGISSDTLTGQGLNSEYDSGNLCPPSVHPTKALEVGSRNSFLLLLGVGVLYKLDLFENLSLGIVA